MNCLIPITRRTSLKQIAGLAAGVSTLGMAPHIWRGGSLVHAAPPSGSFLAEATGTGTDYDVRELTRKLFEQVGGMGRFISKQDVVVIKPNLSWAREPHLAATTNPDVMQAVVELCQEAGAARVRIVDHTIHDARRSFATNGAAQVAQATGADLVFPRSSLMRDMNLQGQRLNVWPVFTPVVEADKVINLPIAKVHGLSGLTLGLKNWIGAVGGRRNALHQDIHQSIVDLARFFHPTLTLIDGIRIMISSGPSGGRPEDVAMAHRLILSDDPVAADTLAAAMFDVPMSRLGFIHLAEKRGLGTTDLNQLTRYQVTL